VTYPQPKVMLVTECHHLQWVAVEWSHLIWVERCPHLLNNIF